MRARVVFMILVASLAFSCSENASEIGIDFFDEGELEVVYVDTLSLRASTVLVDSLVTSTPTRLIVGYHEDTDLGKITVKSYFQVVPPTIGELNNQLRYSRMTLVMNYDKYSYYDTTGNTTLLVHRLTEELQNTKLYTNTAFQYNTTPLGQLTFSPRPNRTENPFIEIPLSNTLGNEFFDLILNKSNTITIQESFLTYFKGLVVVPSTNVSGPMLGFTTTPTLKVYYYDESVTPVVEKSFDFTTGQIRFVGTYIDRSGTPLSSLSAQNPVVNSSLTNDRVYMQAMYGVRTRIEIPYLKNLLLDNSKILLSDAILELTPVRGSFQKNETLPVSASAYIYSVNSELYSPVESTKATLTEDVELGRNTQYRSDISDFIRQQLNFTATSRNNLVFNIPETTLGTTVNRIYLNGTTGNGRMKLRLRYVVLKD